MPDAINVAVDGMGGDNAPGMIVEGLSLAAGGCPTLNFSSSVMKRS